MEVQPVPPPFNHPAGEVGGNPLEPCRLRRRPGNAAEPGLPHPRRPQHVQACRQGEPVALLGARCQLREDRQLRHIGRVAAEPADHRRRQPPPAQGLGAEAPGQASAQNQRAGLASIERPPFAAPGPRQHLPLASIAGRQGRHKASRRQPLLHLPGHRVAGNERPRAAARKHQAEELLRPHGIVLSGRKAIQEPGVGAGVQLRERLRGLPMHQQQPHIVGKPEQMMPLAGARPGGEQFLAERQASLGMKAPQVPEAHRMPLHRHIVQERVLGQGAAPPGGSKQAVHAKAEAQLPDGHLQPLPRRRCGD